MNIFRLSETCRILAAMFVGSAVSHVCYCCNVPAQSYSNHKVEYMCDILPNELAREAEF